MLKLYDCSRLIVDDGDYSDSRCQGDDSCGLV